MLIRVENCNNPGAHFTNNTDSVLVKIFDWLSNHRNYNGTFAQFRQLIERELGINNNNARNIFPFLKYCKFIEYPEGNRYDNFFTNIGKAYTLALKSIKDVDDPRVLNEFERIRDELRLIGLKNIMRTEECNYSGTIKLILSFVLRYEKINKVEFAYLLYSHNKDEVNYLRNMEENINSYRNRSLDFDVIVSVRDDQRGDGTRRDASIDMLTAPTYLFGILSKCRLLTKGNNNYYHINNEFKHEIMEIVNNF